MRGDAARWRAFVALAREVFDKGDAWADEHAEDADTAPMRRACKKGRIALDGDDVGGIVLALLKVGHAERTARSTALAVAVIRRARQKQRGKTKRATFAARDAQWVELLKDAPSAALTSERQAAKWLRANDHATLSERQLTDRLKKCGAITRIS